MRSAGSRASSSFRWLSARSAATTTRAPFDQFGVSFLVSALLAVVQTFFIIETYLVTYLYPGFFKDARPAEVHEVWRISFGKRVVGLWLAVAVGPLVALLAVALNFTASRTDYESLEV